MREKQSKSNNTFASRLKVATGCANISELSQFFGVAHSTISSWIAKSELPPGQESRLMLRGINHEWVKTGKGKKHSAPPPCFAGSAELKVACPLRVDLRRMLKVCDSCAAWAAFTSPQGNKN